MIEKGMLRFRYVHILIVSVLFLWLNVSVDARTANACDLSKQFDAQARVNTCIAVSYESGLTYEILLRLARSTQYSVL